MRGWLVTFLLAGTLAMLVYVVATRPREPHAVPRPTTPARAPDAPDARDARDAEAPSAALSNAEAPSRALGLDATLGGEASPASLGRPIRVVAASWELVAAALVANGGLLTADGSSMRAEGALVRVDVVASANDVDNRLARGGADPEGADFAVVPLPALVSAYEKLQALEPRIVHLVGWSRGREVLLGVREGMLSKARPPSGSPVPGDEATLYSDDVSATALALFALDESGWPASRARLTNDPKNGLLAALARPLSNERSADTPTRLLLTTADASRFVPLVAVAARSFVAGHEKAVAAMIKGWVTGAASLRADVPAAARQLARETGAPEPVAMLERMGWMADATAADGARALGLSGHDVVTVSSLFARDWQLFRDAGILTLPAPSSAPIAPGPLAAALLASSPDAGEWIVAATPSMAGSLPSARVLLARRIDRADAESVATESAWLAGIFERCTVRVSARPASLAKEAVRSAAERFGMASDRFLIASSSLPPGGGAALLEVLAVP